MPHVTPAPSPPPEFDPFALTGGTYDIKEFYLHSTEGGFSAKTPRSSVPPPIAAQMNELVQSNDYPYRTMEAVIRDALFHRLYFLANSYQLPGLHKDLQMWARTERLAAQRARLSDNKRFLDDLSEGCNLAHVAGNYPVLAEMVDSAGEAADALPEDDPHRGHILKTVNRFKDDVMRWRRMVREP